MLPPWLSRYMSLMLFSPTLFVSPFRSLSLSRLQQVDSCCSESLSQCLIFSLTHFLSVYCCAMCSHMWMIRSDNSTTPAIPLYKRTARVPFTALLLTGKSKDRPMCCDMTVFIKEYSKRSEKHFTQQTPRSLIDIAFITR